MLKEISVRALGILGLVAILWWAELLVADADPGVLPANVWMDSRQIPLYDIYAFPPLASVARPVTEPRFKIEELCQSKLPDARVQHGFGGVSEHATINQSAEDWSVQEQIVHYPGDTWTMGQAVNLMFSELIGQIKGCADTSAGARVDISTPMVRCASITSGGCGWFVANVFIPESRITAHIYLASAGNSLAELALWSRDAEVRWPHPADNAVLTALIAPLCPQGQC